MRLSWLPFGNVRAPEALRVAALNTAPLETLERPERAVTLVAGGEQTKGALPLRTALYDGAIYSSRGRGYARYNEDGAALFSDGKGRMYAAVFDQAGGLGGRVRGEASQLAAHRAVEVFRSVATAEGATDLPSVMTRCMLETHAELVERGEGEVTTAVVTICERGAATLVNSGDSAALLYTRKGLLKSHTEKHEHVTPSASYLTHALGLVPEEPAPDTYRWKLRRGDWILLCSDGLLDSGLAAEDLGEVLASAGSAEEAINRIAKRVLRMMLLLQAKPDNLTMVALRAL